MNLILITDSLNCITSEAINRLSSRTNLTLVTEKGNQDCKVSVECVGYRDLGNLKQEQASVLVSASKFWGIMPLLRKKSFKFSIYFEDLENVLDFARQVNLRIFRGEAHNLLEDNSSAFVFKDGFVADYFQRIFSMSLGTVNYYPYLLPLTPSVPAIDRLVDSHTINIGLVCPLFDRTLKAIEGWCRELLGLKDIKSVNFHIFGKGHDSLNLPMSDFSPYIKFIYLGEYSEIEKRKEYLRKNTDFIIAYREQALDCCNYGLPVFAFHTNASETDNITFVPNVKRYDYACRLCDNEDAGISVNQAVSDIYAHCKKGELSRECLDYCGYNSEGSDWDTVLLDIMQESTLTLGDLRSITSLNVTANHINTSLVKNGYDFEKTFHKTVNINNKLIYWDEPQFTVSSKFSAGLLLGAKGKNCLDCVSDALARLKGRMYNWAMRCAIYCYKKHKFSVVQRHYPRKVKQIVEAYRDKKIKVGFIVVFKTSFPMFSVFEKMVDSERYDPYIIVAPNVSRSHHYKMSLLNDAYTTYHGKYPDRTILAYDSEKDQYLELGAEYPILVFCNPYKHLVHPYHEIEYFLDKPVLSIYANYGYAAVSFWKEVISTDFYNLAWKICVENSMNNEYLKQNQIIHGKNGFVLGYPKMDKLASVIKKENERKRILICPHHTVWGWSVLNISNFLKYSDLFVRLPKLFPEVDFIFRPHPLLFPNLKEHKIWTPKQIDEFMHELLDNPNMSYSTVEDYSEEFVRSDAMIHDCASFTAEYLYTNNPCCYMIKSKEETFNTMLPFGKECLSNYYLASDEQDIINFIKDVVLDGKDALKEQRTEFVNEKLRINYPHVAEAFISYLDKELGGE